VAQADLIRAAGAVVWRERGGEVEIALVHRPRYDDWSLPKGKLDDDEAAPVAAVREVLEETGLVVRLGAALPPVSYETVGGPKTVSYWTARVVQSQPRRPDDEVDAVRWVSLGEADELLSYEHDRGTVRAAYAVRTSHPFVVVRHATAVPREEWRGDDRDRPLSPDGSAEAARVRVLLEPWDLDRVITSPAARCLDTVRPYAAAHGLTVEVADELTEEIHELDPETVRSSVRRLAVGRVGTAICTHRPLLASIADVLGVAVDPSRRAEPLPPGGLWVVHRASGAPAPVVERYRV
jgi:8-oxo-dGTP diphosphatase